MITANGLFKYNCDELIQTIHKENCIANNWNYTYLKPYSFGYDNLVVCINHAHNSYDLDIESLAEIIHNAWITNYIFWRDYKPWVNKVYIKPKNALGDKRRNNCAETDYKLLPEEEKEKDRILARIFIKLAKQKNINL